VLSPVITRFHSTSKTPNNHTNTEKTRLTQLATVPAIASKWNRNERNPNRSLQFDCMLIIRCNCPLNGMRRHAGEYNGPL
jgi:hypothetical protein